MNYKIKIKNATFLISCCLSGISIFFIFNKPNQNYNYSVNFTSKDKSYLLNTKNHKQDEINTKIIDRTSSKSGTGVADQPIATNPNSLIKIQDIGNYLGSFSSDLMMASDLQDKFDSDDEDPSLASESEQLLAYIFYQGMEWQKFSPSEITCKNTLCRVTLSPLDQDSTTHLMELISNQMMNNKISFSYAIPVYLPTEKKNIIYFIKN